MSREAVVDIAWPASMWAAYEAAVGRAFTTVNGGRSREGDLFEGIRT